MCLKLTSTPNVKVAEEDIVCYKVVTRDRKYGHTKYRSPYLDRIISYGAKLDNVPVVAKLGRKEVSESDFKEGLVLTEEYGRFVIKGGAIHSYANKADALDSLNDYFRRLFADKYTTYFLVECIIPKGTPYYVGKNYDDEKNYASRELIYKTILAED
jgi:hypothetical protein